MLILNFLLDSYIIHILIKDKKKLNYSLFVLSKLTSPYMHDTLLMLPNGLPDVKKKQKENTGRTGVRLELTSLVQKGADIL